MMLPIIKRSSFRSRAYIFSSDDITSISSEELVLDGICWVLVFDTPNAVLVDCVFMSGVGVAGGGVAAAG